jgi:hypothetical protein
MRIEASESCPEKSSLAGPDWAADLARDQVLAEFALKAKLLQE